ncbi:YndM family protein [Planococcus shenhongbingii]|uniref:YndM family protein n=1 Tax=Planococcus shenhongbingii TaxID=3058398 RepID=A0ABT8NEF2_9BACL|nr:YndM family protein [Planococcus sp. N017]MDN7246281.1 YndM family protein [Planococcus sp. N017]
MNHVKALIMKFIMIAVVLLVILTGIYDVEFEKTLLISLVLTLIAYVLGDLMIFRKTGDGASNKQTGNNHAAGHDRHEDHKKRNMMATIADIVLSFLVIWLLGDALIENAEDIIQAALISALVIGAGEWFFHKYLDKNVFPEKDGRAVTGTTHR